MLRFQLALFSLASIVALAGCTGGDDEPEAADDTGGTTMTPADDDGSTGGDPDDTGGDPDDTGDTGDSGGGASSTGGSGGPDLAELYACEEPDLAIVQPLVGPGFDPETGALLEPVADEYVVSTTQILPKADSESQQAFFELSDGVIAQLMQSQGFLGFSLAAEPTCGFARTLTVWESEEAMYAFVSTGAHAEAMGQTFAVGVTGRVTSWTAPAEDVPPSWEDAIAKIAEVEPIGGY